MLQIATDVQGLQQHSQKSPPSNAGLSDQQQTGSALLMIDSFEAVFPLVHSQPLDISKRARHGRILPFRTVISDLGTEAMIRTAPDAPYCSAVQIRIHVGRFCQGHNLCGPRDFREIIETVIPRVLTRAGVTFGPDDVQRWRNGEFLIKWIDIAKMINLGSGATVARAIEAIGDSGSIPRRSRKARNLGTVLFGFGSRHWSLNFYDKANQIAARMRGSSLPGSPRYELIKLATGYLRVELRLQSRDLQKRRIAGGKHWFGSLAADLLDEKLSGLRLPEPLDWLTNLNRAGRRTRQILEAWSAGVNVVDSYCARELQAAQRWLGAGGDLTAAPPAVARIPRDLLRAILKNDLLAEGVGRYLRIDRGGRTVVWLPRPPTSEPVPQDDSAVVEVRSRDSVGTEMMKIPLRRTGRGTDMAKVRGKRRIGAAPLPEALQTA